MRSFLQNSFAKKTAGLLVGAAICLTVSDVLAATFTLKSGTNLQWNGGTATWSYSNGTPVNNSFPGPEDDVIINNGNQVIINVTVAQCASLRIQAHPTDNGTSLLDVNSRTLKVFGGIIVTGGTGNQIAELRISSGTVMLLGEITNAANTLIAYPSSNGDKNKVTVSTPTYTNGVLNNVKVNQTPSALPVELISFTAAKKNNEVALTWETASEKNNSGFEVQVSNDGKNYEALSFVASRNGNASASQRYAFTHKTAGQEGLVYYRLKQIDLNGDFEYYTAKVVDLGRIAATVNTFPNPFQDRFELNLNSTTGETAQITITDMTGKTVYQTAQKLQKGANTLNVELNNQPAGLYLIKATAGNQNYTNRLVKQ